MNRCIHNKWFLPFFFATAIIFTGCEKIDLGKPVECSIGTRYRINNGLTFTIDSLRDYRCPPDAECLWEGDVDMYFNFDHHSKNLVALINLNNMDRNPISTYGYTWKIQEVNPLYRLDEMRKREDYRIKMIVTKN
jgi:hypothetical protein